MKKSLIMLVCLLCFLNGKSQDAIDYSFGKYNYALEGKKIVSLKIWLTDPKILDGIKGDTGGIGIKVDYSFLDKATKITKGDTLEYLMHFIAVDMPSFWLAFDMNVTKGTILTFESTDGKIERIYDYRDNTDSKLMTNFTSQNCKFINNEMIIRLKLKKKDINSTKLNYFAEV